MAVERDGSKTVYIFLPYYKRGNLQDNINANNLNKTFFPEKELFGFFLKVALALEVLHTHTNEQNELEPYGNILLLSVLYMSSNE